MQLAQRLRYDASVDISPDLLVGVHQHMRKSYSFKRCEFSYTLFRLSDREEMRLRENSLPVSVHHSLQTFHFHRRQPLLKILNP